MEKEKIKVITHSSVEKVVEQVMLNIEEQKKKRYSIGLSVLHGEVQSGKTFATQMICREYVKRFGSLPLITLTYPHIHLWSQVENDYGSLAAVLKLNYLVTLLRTNPTEFDLIIRKYSLIIIEEAEFGNGEEGLLKQLLSALDSANNPNANYNCHIILIGATNYTIVYSELLDGVSIKTSHIKLPIGKNYFGPREILSEGRIIDIGDPKDGDYAINGGKFTKKFWQTFEESFKERKNGLAIIKIKLRAKSDNTSITLCNDVIKYFNKKYPQFITIGAYDTAKGKDYIKNKINEAQSEALINKVVLVMIDGLGAGVRLSQDLKIQDAIRFGYDTSSVGSTTAQSLVGRFSGYYIDNKGEAFKPTYTLIVDESAVEVYCDHHNMLDSGELTEDSLSEYCKPSTWIAIKRTEKIVKPPIVAKLVFNGDYKNMDVKYENNCSYRRWSQFNEESGGQAKYKRDFKIWSENWKIGHEINVNEYTSGEMYKRDEYKQYYIMDMNAYLSKHPVMVFELNDTKPNKELIKKVKKTTKNSSLYKTLA